SFAASAPIASTPPITPRFMAASKIASPASPSASSGAEKEGEKKGEGEKAAATTAADWGLSTSKRRTGIKLKLAGAALVVTAVAGGYLVWSQMFSGNAGGDAENEQ